MSTSRTHQMTGSVAAGSVIAHVYTTSSTIASDTTNAFPADNTVPLSSEGVAYASLDTSITPQSASNDLEVEVFIPWVSASSAKSIVFGIFRDSGNCLATQLVSVSNIDLATGVRLRCVVNAGSTSATTFKVRWGGYSGGTAYIMRTHSISALYSTAAVAMMTVKEIQR